MQYGLYFLLTGISPRLFRYFICSAPLPIPNELSSIAIHPVIDAASHLLERLFQTGPDFLPLLRLCLHDKQRYPRHEKTGEFIIQIDLILILRNHMLIFGIHLYSLKDLIPLIFYLNEGRKIDRIVVLTLDIAAFLTINRSLRRRKYL